MSEKMAVKKLDPEGGRGPQRRVLVAGVEEGGFNPRIKPTESIMALVTEGGGLPITHKIPSSSAASKASDDSASLISGLKPGPATAAAPMTLVQIRQELKGQKGKRYWRSVDELANTP